MRLRLTWFDTLNTIFMLLLSSLVVIPFLYVIAVSFSPATASLGGEFFLIPQDFMLDAYKYLFSTDRFVRSILNTVYITVLGTIINLFFSVTLAYALSKKFLPGRRVMMMMIFFTMIFSAGLIPNYLLVQSLNMLDTYWALMLPSATSAFTIMVMKTFFQSLPESLFEAARIDGANELKILMTIALPLSMPIMATFGLIFMVGHWNEFFGAILYLSDTNMWTIQVLLRQMIVAGTANIGSEFALDSQLATTIGENVKMAAIIVSMVPIVVVYPFLQKYFAQGVMIGSVKE